jgi:hypothetical protein
MATPSRKQATKRVPTQQPNRVVRDARRLDRATQRERSATAPRDASDILIDRDFHAPAEEIEIDPQLDENESAEP